MSDNQSPPIDARAETAPLAELRSGLRTLFAGLDRPMAWRLFAATALAFANGAVMGLAPVALKELIDSASMSAAAQAGPFSLAGLGAVYVLCLAGSRVIAEFRPVLVGAVEQRLYARLRLRYFRHVLALPLSFHRARQTGELGHQLQQAVTGYQVILSCVLSGLVPVLVEAVTVVLMLLTLGQPALALNLAVTALALWLGVGAHMDPLRSAARSVNDTTVEAHSHMADSLVNVEPILCFGAEQATMDRYGHISASLESRWRTLQARRLKMGGAAAGIFTLSVGTSLAIAIHGVQTGALSLGGFVLVTLYMVQLIRPLELLSSASRDISQGLAFVRPLLTVLDAPAAPGMQRASSRVDAKRKRINGHDPSEGAAETVAGPVVSRAGVAVSFRGVRLSFDGNNPILDGVDLDIPAGRSLAIVGESGGGKSSLVRLLLRLCEPDAGSITMEGVSIDTMPVDALRAMIAVVPQDLVLLNGSIRANITLGQEDASQIGVSHAARLAGLHRFIANLPCGYDTMIGERGLKLSGGERQRIAIARALLRTPRLYVFDEASSMLDPHTERNIMRRFKALSRGRTVVVIAHRLSAIQHADEIAVLAGGRIVERGVHADLLAICGHYARMWRAQERTLP